MNIMQSPNVGTGGKGDDQDRLKWFARWNREYRSWEVMKGGFRDSLHESKYLAETRCDELNRIDA